MVKGLFANDISLFMDNFNLLPQVFAVQLVDLSYISGKSFCENFVLNLDSGPPKPSSNQNGKIYKSSFV